MIKNETAAKTATATMSKAAMVAHIEANIAAGMTHWDALETIKAEITANPKGTEIQKYQGRARAHKAWGVVTGA